MANRLSTGQLLLAADVEGEVVDDEVEVDALDAEPDELDEVLDEDVSDVVALPEPFEPRESVR